MTRSSKAIASTFHPTHEITLTRLDGTREIVPVMLVDDDAYTLAEWVKNADAPAGWKRSDVGWRWYGRQAPDGYKTAKVSRLGRGSDPKGPRAADARLSLRLLREQLQTIEFAANNERMKPTDWAVKTLVQEADFCRLKQEWTDGKIELELDVTQTAMASDEAIEIELWKERDEQLSRGLARVARSRPKGAKRFKSMAVTDSQCGALVALGAKWVGPEEYAPGRHWQPPRS